MTWQWVTLILGFFFLLFLTIAFQIWANMRTEMFKAVPRSIPELFTGKAGLGYEEELKAKLDKDAAQKSSVPDGPDKQDTLVEHRWPEGFTGKDE